MKKHEGDILRKFFKSLEETQDEISEKLGFTRQNLNYHLCKETLDGDFMRLVKEHFPKANVENIFSDSMVNDNQVEYVLEKKTDKKSDNSSASALNNVNYMNVPLVSEYAYGGYLGGYSDKEYIESLPHKLFIIDSREYKGNYVAFEVRGDSMDNDSIDSYIAGDIVLCREIGKQYWKSKLHISKWDFVIVHKTEGILIKKIVKHNVEKGIITIHSLNPMYDDMDLKLSQVEQLFNVIKLERKK